MKKIAFFLTAVAVTLFSCEKEQDVTSTAESTLAGKKVTIKASHEIGSDPEAKTVLAIDGSVTWAGGETLKVVYYGSSDSDLTDAAEAGSTATFTFTTGAGNNYLVYPSTIYATYDGTDFEVTVPASQDGTFANAAIEVAQYDGSATCHLKNLGALLEITVTADVDQIVLHSNNSTPLVGTATVTFDDGIPSVSSVASGSTSVTLSELSGAGTYYAAVLPDSYDAGIYVELKKSGNLVGERISGNTLAVARRQIKPLPVGNPGVIANKKFFKPDGTGDGSSWDNAGGVTLLDAVLSGASDATLFLAQGVYSLADIDGISTRTATKQCISVSGHSFSIFGGYPDNATGTSLANRDITAETAISGADTYRILLVSNSSARISADGMTFKNALYTVNNGYGSALVLENHANAYFNHCTIKDNKTDTASSAYGGAVRAKGHVTFANCLFENNLANKASGGAIFVPSSGSPILTLENCSFSNNRAPSGTGGVFLMYGGTLNARNCTFSGSSSGNGGVLRVVASAVVSATFTGCVFDGNYSTSAKQNDVDGALAGTGIGGAVFSLNGASGKVISLTVENCELKNNVAHPSKTTLTKDSTLKGAGGVASIGQYSNVRMRDCLMRYNYAGMASFIVSANSSLYMDRCRFWENRGLQDATVVYNNGGTLAMHNCSIQNSANLQTQTSGHSNCYFFNTDTGAMFLSCTTLRSASATPLFKGGDSTPDNNTAIFNNSLLSTSTTGGIFDADAKYTSKGYNLVTSLDNWAGKVDSDYNLTATTSNPSKNTTYFCLQTSLAGTSFTKADKADFESAISTFDTNNDANVLSWLGADAINVDILKHPRNNSKIMPGSYE